MIELKSVQKVVDQKTVIDIETLLVPDGEIAALVGPVGSGTDTLFDLLLGRFRPSAGEIRLAGIDPFAQRNQFIRQVGVLFAEDDLYQRQTALGNLVFHCRLRRLPTARALEVLTQVGLADQADTAAGKLSSSLARRLAFGRAILHNPAVLLLCDPFARCDDASVSLLSTLMRRQAGGCTVLAIAPDTTNLTALCDTIYRLDQGQISDAYKPQAEPRVELPFMIPVRMEGRVVLLNPVDILYVEAQADHTFVQSKDGRLPTQFTMDEIERRLAPSGFFRAHRGYLVNLQHVREVIPYTRNSFCLKLRDAAGTEIPLSKAAAAELRRLLDF